MSQLWKKDELAELKAEVAELKTKMARQEVEIAQLKGNSAPQLQVGKKTRIAIMIVASLILGGNCLFIAFLFVPGNIKWFAIAGIIAIYW